MCYAVYLATTVPQQTSDFLENVTKIYLKIADEIELVALKRKFTQPYIYYVGSDMKCSCGFDFKSEFFDDPEWQERKESSQALINLIAELTSTAPIEYYCCWHGDWHGKTETFRSINISDTSLETNYFELIERDFINFYNN